MLLLLLLFVIVVIDHVGFVHGQNDSIRLWTTTVCLGKPIVPKKCAVHTIWPPVDVYSYWCTEQGVCDPFILTCV